MEKTKLFFKKLGFLGAIAIMLFLGNMAWEIHEGSLKEADFFLDTAGVFLILFITNARASDANNNHRKKEKLQWWQEGKPAPDWTPDNEED